MKDRFCIATAKINSSKSSHNIESAIINSAEYASGKINFTLINSLKATKYPYNNLNMSA